MHFHTSVEYVDRESKAKYVWEKYQDILKGNILDVGADQCYLKNHLGSDSSYLGIGKGDGVDLQLDLEKEPIPFESDRFDCVLCLDVLEHVQNIQEVFHELYRVSKRYVLISLPNPHGDYFYYLKHGDYRKSRHLKFYGLPKDSQEDRHKWFFSTEEAETFIRMEAKKYDMEITQIDIQGDKPPRFSILEKFVFKYVLRKYSFLLHNRNLHTKTLWALLNKKERLEE